MRDTTRGYFLRASERRVLNVLGEMGTQRMIKPIALRARMAPTTASRALRRLDELGLVNLHYAQILGRKQLRWIVPVDIPRRAA